MKNYHTRQSLPDDEYLEMLGVSICTFNSNVGFVIENILHTDSTDKTWYELIDMEAGQLPDYIVKTISKETGNDDICNLFHDVVDMRNRIIHSFRITNSKNEQVLATKTKIEKGNVQFEITKDYMCDFIDKNQELSDMLYSYRSLIQNKK